MFSFLRICLEFILSVHGLFQKVARRKPYISIITRSIPGEIFLAFSTLTISTILCTISGIILFFLTIYRYVIDKYLRLKHKNDYVGLIHGTDAVWAIEDNSRGIINGLMIIETDYEPEEFFVRMKKRVCNSLLKSKKFRYVRGKFGGYLYYLRNRMRDDDVVGKIEIIKNGEELDKDELMILLSNYCNKKLPYDDCGTNEVLIGLQSVKWRGNKKCKYQYPVLYRLHHCIGDGISMQQLVMKTLTDGNVTTVISEILKKDDGGKKKKGDGLWKIFMKIVRLSAHRLAYLEEKEVNFIHGKELSGEKHLVCCVEDEPEHLEMIKNIKKNLGEGGFSEVCVSAVAASFSDYFHQNQKKENIPKIISAAVTVIPPNEKIDINDPKIPTHNRFSLTLVGLQLEKKESILDVLKYTRNEFNCIKNAIDVVWNYWQMKHIFGLLPTSTVKSLMDRADSSIGFSILPGTNLVTICDGLKVLDFIFWIPNKAIVGLGISLYTYDDRIQLGLLADKTVLPKYEDAKMILKGIFSNIENMYIASLEEKKNEMK
nr:uncharacterized protein LOC111416800 [Onthophagus taurus]